MVTKNGDMTISSWCRQLWVHELRKFRSDFRGNWEWRCITPEETMVLHGRWTYFKANSRDGGEESFQDKACNDDDHDDGGVAGEENKWINIQINKWETRLEPGRTPRSGHLPETKGKKRKKRNAEVKIPALSIIGPGDRSALSSCSQKMRGLNPDRNPCVQGSICSLGFNFTDWFAPFFSVRILARKVGCAEPL